MAASSRCALAAAASALFLFGAHAQAQEAPWAAEPAPAAQDQEKPAAAPKAQRPATAKSGGEGESASQESGDAKLRQRVEQLEEQLVDLQVVIGTLETLARGGGAKAPEPGGMASGGPVTGEQARLDGMETQIRALTAQIEQLSNEVRGQAGVPRRSDAGAPPAEGGAASAYPSAATGTATSRFGSTTVTSGSADPIGELAAGSPGWSGKHASSARYCAVRSTARTSGSCQPGSSRRKPEAALRGGLRLSSAAGLQRRRKRGSRTSSRGIPRTRWRRMHSTGSARRTTCSGTSLTRRRPSIS